MIKISEIKRDSDNGLCSFCWDNWSAWIIEYGGQNNKTVNRICGYCRRELIENMKTAGMLFDIEGAVYDVGV
jgi:hypothetical protein